MGHATSWAGYDLNKKQCQLNYWCNNIHLQFHTHALWASSIVQDMLEAETLKMV